MHVRSLFAVALVAILAGPGAAQAQKKSSQKTTPTKATPADTSSTSQLAFDGWLGYESGDLSGLKLQVDGVMPYKRLSPQVDLSFVGSLGYSYLTKSAAGADVTGNLLKLVPAARFTVPLTPEFSVFGDAGAGLYLDWVSTSFLGQSASSSGAGFMLRFAVGGFYKMNPKLQLGVMLDLDPMFGDYDNTTFSFMGGLRYQL